VGTSQLLDWLATSPQGARLTSLEWNFTGYSIDEYDIAPLIKFLQSSRGLEDLFLLYPREYALEPEYWSALPHHHDTLRRVVHQQSSQKGRLKNDDEAEEMIRILGAFKRITYLGTCCQPGTLVSTWYSMIF
jgi:hypothetical protein